jgi:hypothetical protein
VENSSGAGGRFELRNPAGPILCDVDGAGMRLVNRRPRRRIPWSEVTGGGAAPLAPASRTGLPTSILPGLGWLTSLQTELSGSVSQLVIARGRSSFLALRLPIFDDDPGARALQAEIAGRLGERWIGRKQAPRDLARALGLRTPVWLAVLSILFVLILVATVLLAAVGVSAILTGRFREMPPWAYVPLLAWLALIAWFRIRLRAR